MKDEKRFYVWFYSAMSGPMTLKDAIKRARGIAREYRLFHDPCSLAWEWQGDDPACSYPLKIHDAARPYCDVALKKTCRPLDRLKAKYPGV